MTTLGAGVRPLQGGIFKSAAVAVLRLEKRLMTTGEITKVALEKALIKCQGRTPEATMASALYTDVKRKLSASVFTRPQEGLFGLREWEEEGFAAEHTTSASLAESTAEVAPPPKRQRSGATRPAKRAERMVSADSEANETIPACSSPSPLIDAARHVAGFASPQKWLPFGQMPSILLSSASDCSTATGLQCAQESTDFESILSEGSYQFPNHVALESECSLGSRAVSNNERSTATASGECQSRKRPFAELELPPQECLPTDAELQRLLSSPESLPLYEAFAAPHLEVLDSFALPLYGSPHASPDLHAEHLPAARCASSAAFCIMRPPCSTAASELKLSLPLRVDLESAADLTCLDTPSLMRLPLPVGDLSWTPLCLRGEDAFDSTGAAATLPELMSFSKPLAGFTQGGLGDAIACAAQPELQLLTMPQELNAGSPALFLGHADAATQQPSSASERYSLEAQVVAEKLHRMESEVLRQEAELGEAQPIVGESWLALFKAYQAEDPQIYAAKAEQALIRAWHVCSSCLGSHEVPACEAPFDFILGTSMLQSQSDCC